MASRKLQGEIDKIMKKVTEGIVEFDGILKKVYAATSSNQKEKYEGDLKKEIKKLQRYRDQIKVWITSNEVKHKAPLIDCRKLIETKMEQFKACEKETKTKAYSKEGLGLQKQDNDGRNEARNWVVKGIDSLKAQIDQFESELENIPARKKKQEGARVEQLSHQVERHQFHLNALELILRYLDNERLSVNKVMEIKDAVEYYIESNQDPYFAEEEDIYDPLGIRIDASGEEKDDGSEYDNVEIDGENDDTSEDGTTTDEKDDADDKAEDSESHSAPSTPSNAAITNKNAKKEQEKKEDKSKAQPATQPTPQPLPLPLPLPVPKDDNKRAAQPQQPQQQTQQPQPQPQQRRPDNVKQGPPPGLGLPQNQLSPQRNNRTNMPVHTPERKTDDGRRQHMQTTPPPVHHQQLPQSSLPLAPPVLNQPPPASLAAKHSFLQQQYNQLNLSKDDSEVKDKSSPTGNFASDLTELNELSDPLLVSSRRPSVGRSQEGLQGPRPTTPPGLPVPAATAAAASNPNSAAAMLAASFANIPESIDTERPNTYLPKTPSSSTPQQQYYPALPLPVFEVPSIFEKFDTDTLFFIFYYQQGTYQQYLAARELKKQSWRYHKKYLTWFQRHEEPKEITNEYEQGTVVSKKENRIYFRV